MIFFERCLVSLYLFLSEKHRLDSQDLEVWRTYYDEEGPDRENKFPRNLRQESDCKKINFWKMLEIFDSEN